MEPRRRLTPGELVWIGPDASLYPNPATASDGASNVDVESNDDWDLCLIIAVNNEGWVTILFRDQLRITPINNLMSLDTTPSSVSAR